MTKKYLIRFYDMKPRHFRQVVDSSTRQCHSEEEWENLESVKIRVADIRKWHGHQKDFWIEVFEIKKLDL